MSISDHVIFQVGDLDEAIPFYVDKLGFRLISRGTNKSKGVEQVFLSREDLNLELEQDMAETDFIKPEVNRPFCPNLVIEVPDIIRAASNLRKQGVKILCGPLVLKGEEAWMYFTDPDNNILEYIQWFRK